MLRVQTCNINYGDSMHNIGTTVKEKMLYYKLKLAKRLELFSKEMIIM